MLNAAKRTAGRTLFRVHLTETVLRSNIMVRHSSLVFNYCVWLNPHCRVSSKTVLRFSSCTAQNPFPTAQLCWYARSKYVQQETVLQWKKIRKEGRREGGKEGRRERERKKEREARKEGRRKGKTEERKEENKNLKISTKKRTWNLLGAMFQYLSFLQKPRTLSYYIPITHSKLFSRGRRQLFLVYEGTGSPSGK